MILTKTLAFLGLAAATCAAAGCLAADAWIEAVARSLGDTRAAIAEAGAWRPPEGGSVVLAQGQTVTKLGARGSAWTPLEAIRPSTLAAFEAAEDKTFWINAGIDPAAMMRAVAANATRRGRRAAGASTITQQLVKIALMGGRVSGLRDKTRQIVLALRMSETLTKSQILEQYLNRVYFGRSWTGISEASHGYFGKPPGALDLAEAATLAGLIRNPSSNDPIAHPSQSQARRRQVLASMTRDGFAEPEDAQRAGAEDVKAAVHSPRADEKQDPLPGGVGWAADLARVEKPDAGAAGRRLELTISPDLQSDAELALQIGLMRWDARLRGWRGRIGRTALPSPARTSGQPDPGDATAAAAAAAADGRRDRACAEGCPEWTRTAVVLNSTREGVRLRSADETWHADESGFSWLTTGPAGTAASLLRRGDIILAGRPPAQPDNAVVVQPTSLQGSVITMSTADGSILALAGGMAWTPGGFDRATASLRPPGSTFKPFVYLAALDRGYHPWTTVLDLPITLPDGRGGWSPGDDDGRWEGPLTMSAALAESRNGPAVRLFWTLGEDTVSEVARSFGIYAGNLPPAAALGAQESTEIALTSAYATLASHGVRFRPHVVRADTPTAGFQVADAESVDALAEMMRHVLEPGGTAEALAGLAADFNRRGHPLSAKTGTSDGFKDAWIIGFAGGVATGVRIGYDTPRSMGPEAFGAAVAGPVFAAVMQAADRRGLLLGAPP